MIWLSPWNGVHHPWMRVFHSFQVVEEESLQAAKPFSSSRGRKRFSKAQGFHPPGPFLFLASLQPSDVGRCTHQYAGDPSRASITHTDGSEIDQRRREGLDWQEKVRSSCDRILGLLRTVGRTSEGCDRITEPAVWQRVLFACSLKTHGRGVS